MGIRFILLAVALWLLLSGLRHLARQRKKDTGNKTSGHYVNTVSCAHCGTHIPQDKAIHRGKRYYCCEKHARQGDKEAQKLDA